ncbi:MAG: CoA-transferase, partial [Elusimicrobiota bacterium]
NINTTVVGSYAKPKVRLPGSGGACEIAVHAQRVLIVMKLSKRTFMDKVDFITSPGTRPGGKPRGGVSMPGRGPVKVITDMGILEPDPATGELALTSIYPGVTVEKVRENIGWDLKVREPLGSVDLPAAAEITLLREKLDPRRLHIK